MSRGWGGVDFVRNRCLSHKQRGVSTIFTPIRLWHHQYFRSTARSMHCKTLASIPRMTPKSENVPQSHLKILIRRLEAQFLSANVSVVWTLLKYEPMPSSGVKK